MGAILDKLARWIGWLRAAYSVYQWHYLWLPVLIGIGTVTWGYIDSIPLPSLVLNGLTFLFAIIWLPFIPGLFRLIRAGNAPADAQTAMEQERPIDLAIWRHMQFYTLRQACYLWAGLNPPHGMAPIQDGAAADRYALLTDAIRGGTLGVARGHDSRFPDPGMRVPRPELIRYALTLGNLPPFLQD